jgi:hypothetical protein
VLTINSKRGKRRKATERIKKSKILKREKAEDDIKDGTIGRCEYSKKPLMIGVIYKKNKIRGEKCKTTEMMEYWPWRVVEEGIDGTLIRVICVVCKKSKRREKESKREKRNRNNGRYSAT